MSPMHLAIPILNFLIILLRSRAERILTIKRREKSYGPRKKTRSSSAVSKSLAKNPGIASARPSWSQWSSVTIATCSSLIRATRLPSLGPNKKTLFSTKSSLSTEPKTGPKLRYLCLVELASNVESAGCTSLTQTLRRGIGRMRRIFRSSSSIDRLALDGARLQRRWRVAPTTRLRTASTLTS